MTLTQPCRPDWIEPSRRGRTYDCTLASGDRDDDWPRSLSSTAESRSKGGTTPRFPPESIDQTNRKNHHQHTMTTDITVYWDDQMLDHEPPKGLPKFFTPIVAVPEVHPDRFERVQNIRAMEDHAFGDIFETVWPDLAAGKRSNAPTILTILTGLVEFCADGGGCIAEDTTTGLNEHTYDAARVSAGIAAAGQALDGSKDDGQEALPMRCVAQRGHYAQPDCADGFCYSTTSRAAAEAALLADGPADITADRVAIIDGDVHHHAMVHKMTMTAMCSFVSARNNDHGSWHPEYHPQEGLRSLARVTVRGTRQRPASARHG